MKASIPCKIVSTSSESKEGFVVLDLVGLHGKVDVKMVPAQDCTIFATLSLKPVIANKLKIGSIVHLEISVNEEE